MEGYFVLNVRIRNMGIEYVNVPPDAERIIDALRDTGYQIESAIEDIIDNSITHGEATKIDVNIEMDFAGNVEVFIADNGSGMDREKLINAMKYGSKKVYKPSSLGKFGIGLKTASTAFCKKLTVVSKTKDMPQYLKATWDLDYVAEVDDWDLAIETPDKEELKQLEKTAGINSGTLVIWRKVDRILKGYSDPAGAFAHKALDRMLDGLIEHSSMVYQRFLDHSDERTRNIEITINGRKLKSFNPFIPEESDIVAEQPVELEINGKRTASFFIRAYILPHKFQWSSQEAYLASRPGNEYQGIYVYRENRLIYGPGWMKMYSKEPHGSLLRIEFSFDHTLDEVFLVDIKKSQIHLNEDLYRWLKEEFLGPPRRAADQRYRLEKKKGTEVTSKDLHDESNANIHNKAADVSESNITIINKEKGLVDVTNKEGTTRTTIKILVSQKPGQVHIQPVPNIDDGLLWEPCLIDKNKGLRINTGHEYYSKVYLPNKNSGAAIQGLDSLLWALSEAELTTINERTVKHFEEMRREVSHILRVLVEDLPEPADNDSEK